MNLEQSTPQRRPSRRSAPRPIAVPIDGTCRITGLGRTKIYELIAGGKRKSVTVGRRRLVVYDSIEALLQPAV